MNNNLVLVIGLGFGFILGIVVSIIYKWYKISKLIEEGESDENKELRL